MEIRRTLPEEINEIMTIYDRARQFMRNNGNENQWINGYPSVEIVMNDINKRNSYVCVDEKGIIATFCFIQGVEPNYLKIYEGKWMNDEPYGVVHRIATTGRVKGIASYCIEWCFTQCRNIRIDTHRDNKIMQRVLIKNGFLLCGVIHVADGSERVAFQKILQ